MLIYNNRNIGTNLGPDEMIDILSNELVLPAKREYPNFDTLTQDKKDTIIIALAVNLVDGSKVNIEDIVGVNQGRIRDYIAYLTNNTLIAMSEHFIINHSRYKSIIDDIITYKFNFVLNVSNPVTVQLGFYKLIPDEMATAIKENTFIYTNVI